MRIIVDHQTASWRLRSDSGAELYLSNREYEDLRRTLAATKPAVPKDPAPCVPITEVSDATLQLEGLRRAILRNDSAITRAEQTLRSLQEKRVRQTEEWRRQCNAIAERV